jgi:hypothetical protein
VSKRSVDDLLELIENQGSLAVAELFSSEASPSSALASIGEAVKTLYWKRKDLPRAVLASIAGISAGTVAAGLEADEGARADLMGGVKALAYNVGSYTWPGWNEKGISPGATDLVAGLEAARLNLRLAGELNKGDLPVARGHWLVGAQLAAAGDLAAAREQFEESAAYAGKARKPGEQALAQAFAGLVGAALAMGDDPGRAKSREQLRAALETLSGIADGDAFIEQVRTAALVFGWTELLPEEK